MKISNSLKFLEHGEIYVEGNGVATTIGLISTWYQFDKFAVNGQSHIAIPDYTNNHIIIGSKGIYLVMVSASFSGTANNDYEIKLKKNNGATDFNNIHTERALNASGDIGSVSMSGLISVNPGDTIELWVQNNTGGNNITIKDCNLTIIQIG